MTEEIKHKFDELKVSDASQDPVTAIYTKPADASPSQIKHVFESTTPDEQKTLNKRIDSDIKTTIELIKKAEDSKLLMKKLTKERSLPYLQHLRQSLKTSPSEFTLTLIDAFINNFQYTLDELTPTISSILPFISAYQIVTMSLIKFYALFKDSTIPVLSDGLEVLTIEEDYIASFKLMALIFQLNHTEAAQIFSMNTLQLLLYQVPTKSSSVIKEALTLLSAACVDEAMRKEISEKYLEVLIAGCKADDKEIQSLAALVVVKTWNFAKLKEKGNIGVEELMEIFLSELNESSIEGLTYLSIKKSVRVRLRSDDEFVFDLTKMLDNPQGNNVYGTLVLLANMTSIEEENEINQLKKQANKGLDDDVEETPEEVEEFMSDLIERQVIAKICSLSKMSKASMNQVITIIFNSTRKRNNHAEVIKQGALLRLLDYLGREPELTDTKMLAYRALAALLVTANPQLVFNTYSPKSAVNFLFQFIAFESTSLKDQFQSLLSLTNLSILDNGRLTELQWDTIDDLLTQQNTLLRRATLELISNLMQHKSNLPDLFDPTNSKAQKRLELVVKLTTLDDIKSQCSAVAALSFAATFPFIGADLAKNKTLIKNLVNLIDEQSNEPDLMERVLFVTYNVLFAAGDAGEFNSEKLISGCAKVLKTNQNTEAKEMASEIIKMIK